MCSVAVRVPLNKSSSTVTANAVGTSGLGTVPDANTDPVTGQVTGPGTPHFRPELQ